MPRYTDEQILALEAQIERLTVSHGELAHLLAECARQREELQQKVVALSHALERAYANDPEPSSFRVIKY